MSARTGSCTRKDKRLLVLLAFGAAIALFRLVDPAVGRQQAENRWAWLEIKGETGRVYRFTLQQGKPVRPDDIAVPVNREAGEGIDRRSLHILLDGNRALSFRIDENGAAAATNVSPRLSFLLGLPFPINHANEDELTLLPGIGPALAARITEYRESRGVIADHRELRSVRGIGRRLEARLAPYLTFEED
jgi:hypothetical protein